MACQEAEQLKAQVLKCTNVYLDADNQRTEAAGDKDIVADFAMYALAEARRKYWFHVNQHRCESFEEER